MKAAKNKYDYIVVGSGAGGGTLFRELAIRGKDVLCIEWGSPFEKIGTMMGATFDFNGTSLCRLLPRSMHKSVMYPPRTKEGVITWRAIGAGGTSVLSMGNGARSMEDELASMGVDLEAESEETENEVGLDFLTERLLGKGSRAIRDASEALGYSMVPMPKSINAKKCVKCHKCLYGCSYGAKWDTLAWISEAEENGADIIYDTKVLKVTRSNGKVQGVSVKGPGGKREIKANTVILSSGGMATPVILQNSGIKEAGGGFFLDMFWTTYGITSEKGLNLDKEPNMPMVALEWYNNEGFLLSPYVNHDRTTRVPEMNPLRAMKGSKNMLGIMTKISDDANGRVYPDGTCSKPVTERDWKRLKQGAGLSRDILKKVGVKPDSLFESKIQGAHPGGTAAIGTVVDADLQTKIDNLFVCDASVFPAQEFNDKDRLPPILTIVALAKRLAKTLSSET